ncbi:hypothetical protein FHS32_004983 [Streptomyces albaduncus]|uniref:Uncharacterized protein n=1 Tax=Streptomyces griseoloalbus TaxID=67303 RepID=A0A7W8F9J5_9ACTN|nr:hypothetical protein [Streptomyces albaduncus]GGW53974.1 hypothetical protein GCM10010340_35650 [Streptomyces albaduncus]
MDRGRPGSKVHVLSDANGLPLPEPADLLPKNNNAKVTGFRLSLLKSMGSGRGNAETGFIRSVDDAVHRFYTAVVVHLDAPTTRRAPSRERATTG